jgi:O-acetyl-ADP-ribose deacetylase (regulator of RNase III)
MREGDIFQSKADVLVNPVNCVGICGKGLAKAFKEKFPKNYSQYIKDCGLSLYKPGDVIICNKESIFIANMAIKAHWRQPSKIEWIEKGLKELSDIIFTNRWSVAIPAVGCGNDSLDWYEEVRPLIWKYFFDIDDILIEVYEPNDK